jgi:hypothetical protein
MILEGQTSSENSTSWYLLPPSAESKPGGEIPTPITRSQQAGRERCGDPAWSRLPRSRRGSLQQRAGVVGANPYRASMTFARRLAQVDNIPQQDSAERAFNKLTRTFAAQMSALKEYRSKGRAKDDRPACTRRRRRTGHRRQRQCPTEGHRGGRGARKKWRSTPCTCRVPRCRAISKRSGKPCQAPAVRGHEVCRMHGARGGAPMGNRNALKHGAHIAKARALNREIQALARMARATMAEIG